MTLPFRLTRRAALLGAALSMFAGMQACAVTPAVAPAKAYAGRFESPCILARPGSLSFVDVLVLSPIDDKTVSVGMHKDFYSGDGCPADTRIGSLQVPTGQMSIVKQVKLGKRLVDQVVLNLPSGAVVVDNQVGPKGQGRIELTSDAINIHHGKAETFSLGNTADAGTEKDLRWLDQEKGRLYVGHPEQPGPEGFPAAIDEESFFTKR